MISTCEATFEALPTGVVVAAAFGHFADVGDEK